MDFIVYDITLLILFAIFISVFLYTKRKNLRKEGLLFLYRTKWGVKLINYIGKKYKRLLKVLSYVSIGFGYILMATMLYLFYIILRIYAFRPDIVREIKVPPIMPLIPYIDKIVPNLPSFYFIYWIIIIAVIAITHEFSHGIFMKRYNIRIKSTGFGFFPFFLPIFPVAFVEQDEKSMKRKRKFEQMAVLSAGTFANILTAIFCFGILWLFFSLAFSPAGVIFDTYAYSIVGIASISSVNGIPLSNASYEGVLDLVNETGLNKIESKDDNYLITKDFLEKQKNDEKYVLLYDDSPAINAGLTGVIIEVNGVKVDSREKLGEELLMNSPGEKITIQTKTEEEILEYEIILGEHPNNKSLAWLGIGFIGQTKSGIFESISFFQKPNVYYESSFGAGLFIYNLFWWLILISIGVALINMLPVGIFDGGRFFYLTVLAITKNEKKAKNFFKFTTYFFLLLFFLLMAFWIRSFI